MGYSYWIIMSTNSDFSGTCTYSELIKNFCIYSKTYLSTASKVLSDKNCQDINENNTSTKNQNQFFLHHSFVLVHCLTDR